MGSVNFILAIAILSIFISIIFLCTAFIFYKYIYSPHKVRTSNMSLPDLLVVLQTVINTELDLYEKNIFSTKGALTNSNFENFYKDIVNSIINALSQDFFVRMSFFINQDAIVTIICRTVKDYLAEKVNTVTI